VNVPGLGSLGISPILSLPSIVIPANTGMGSLKISLPNDPKLSNVKFYLQSLVVPIGTPAGLSNLFPEQVK
jgi:hypothetical protein